MAEMTESVNQNRMHIANVAIGAVSHSVDGFLRLDILCPIVNQLCKVDRNKDVEHRLIRDIITLLEMWGCVDIKWSGGDDNNLFEDIIMEKRWVGATVKHTNKRQFDDSVRILKEQGINIDEIIGSVPGGYVRLIELNPVLGW